MRTSLCAGIVVAFALAAIIVAAPESAAPAGGSAKVLKFARFQAGQTVAYGLVEDGQVRQISGSPFGRWSQTEQTYALADVKLLAPVQPSKVLALAVNYRSHAGTQAVPVNPEVFYKPPSCLIANGEPIVLPKDSREVHYEGELVIVIGKRAKNVPRDKALDYVLGVTCGNDVSARDWQKNDKQWWRAKGADTFGPCGPFIVSGINYDDLELVSRVDGQVKQKERTRDMVHGVAATVSFISRFVTLEPGDLIFTGTPGETAALKPGDIVEVEIEGVGTLRNPVVAE